VDERVVRLINGGANVAEELLTHRVDAILYTGGSKVGQIVALAAARSLTPIFLELGGKNPVFVTRNAHIKSRIA
jgi:aldehyde dehydrogenase (NAD+)